MILRPENIARHELIGLFAKVAESTDPGLVGLSGKIVDETKNTFLIESEGRQKRIAKGIASFVFSLPDGYQAKVVGSILISQPENRISKKIQRTRWKL